MQMYTKLALLLLCEVFTWITPGCTLDRIVKVSLVGGPHGSMGIVTFTVESGLAGAWCRGSTTQQVAQVICKTLGYSGPALVTRNVLARSGYTSPSTSGRTASTRCNGNENTIQDCSDPGIYSGYCNSGNTEVVCSVNTANVTVALFGDNPAKGTVMLTINGVTGKLCTDTWDIKDAIVVCNMLGYTGHPMISYGHDNPFPAPSSSTWFQPKCDGNENSIIECYQGVLTCSPSGSRSPGLDCAVTNLGVTLIGGPHKEGYVMYIYVAKANNQRLGYLCGEHWGAAEAIVVCRMLGHQGHAIHKSQKTGTIYQKNPMYAICNGTEDRLEQCQFNAVKATKCNPNNAPYIICNAKINLAVRLVDGKNQKEGRVEILLNGERGTVCDDNWTTEDATVICRMLGYSGPGATAVHSKATGIIWLHNVQCTGAESSIKDCQYLGWGISSRSCGHHMDVGVACDVCPEPDAAENAERSKGIWSHLSTVTYKCNNGYEHQSGTLMRTCQADKTWSGSVPVCNKVSCGYPGMAVAGVIKSGSSYLYSDVVTYNCEPGWIMHTGYPNITCRANKSWSGYPLVCQKINCQNPDTAGKALNAINPDTKTSTWPYWSTVNYTCSSGYELESGNLQRTCMASKTWSGRAPVCTVVSCGDPGKAAVGVVKSGSNYLYSDVVAYNCKPGWEWQGGATNITCMANKSWSGHPLVCQMPTPKSDNAVTRPFKVVQRDISSATLLIEFSNDVAIKYGPIKSYTVIVTTNATANQYAQNLTLPTWYDVQGLGKFTYQAIPFCQFFFENASLCLDGQTYPNLSSNESARFKPTTTVVPHLLTSSGALPGPMTPKGTQKIRVKFLIGADISCKEKTKHYCNGPLKPSTYYVKLRALKTGKDGSILIIDGPYSEPLKVGFQDIPNHWVLGLIIGLASLGVLLVICSVIGIILWRKSNRSQQETGKAVREGLDMMQRHFENDYAECESPCVHPEGQQHTNDEASTYESLNRDDIVYETVP